MEARTSRRRLQLSTAIVCAAAMSLLAIAIARAYVPVGADFRISNVGPDADANRNAFSSAVAYNAAANEYLVVWEGDGLADTEFEVFGQRVSAAGTEIGADFRISNATDIGADHDAFDPAVAYNAAADEYLVVWHGDGLVTEGENEIFGQRVSAAGVVLAGDFRISNMGTDADVARDALNPAVAYNAAADEYLVTWEGDGLATDDDFEIFGQRVSATGIPILGDFRISNATDIPVTRDALDPAVAYNAAADEYLVSWEGDALPINDWFEIFGQRVSATGAEIGADFRISHVTAIGRDALDPAVAYGAAANEYLVTWEGNGLATVDEIEIFGQLVSAAGAEIGGDFRISNVGTDADAARDAFNPAVAYGASADEYLVTWEGDGLATEGESEIFGQRVSAMGAEIGGDFRISNVGTDSDANRDAAFSAAAYSAAADEYLVTWVGDGLATEDELENFGRRLALVPPTPTQAAPTPSTAPRCKGRKATLFARTGLGRRFNGSSKRDVIVGTSGRDRIKGRGGNDIVCARGGRDKVSGGRGKDRLFGQGGKDKLFGQGGKDRLFGQGGRDLLRGGAGKDKLKGGGGKDRLYGQRGKDQLFGQGGKDLLRGGGGKDKLKGGGGKDSQAQ